MSILRDWSLELRRAPPALEILAKFLDPSIEAASLVPSQEINVRGGNGIDVVRRQFGTQAIASRERFLNEVKVYLSPISNVETAEFEIVGIKETANSPVTVECEIRYDLVGTQKDIGREQRVGSWRMTWARDKSSSWRVLK